MSTSRPKLEGKRKMFRAITSRISHYNHTDRVDMNVEDNNDDTVDVDSHDVSAGMEHKISLATHTDSGPTPAKTQTQKQTHSHTHTLNQQDMNMDIQHHSKVQNSKQANHATSLPVTQGSEVTNYNNTSFSYLESLKKAPSKKRSYFDPNDSTSPSTNQHGSNAKIRAGISIKSKKSSDGTLYSNHSERHQMPKSGTISGVGNESPSTETSLSTDMSFMNKSNSVILNHETVSDMNEYDYKTFSTNHPLMFSKVKAFEQSEMMTKQYFSKFKLENNTKDEEFISKKKNSVKHVDKEIILQIPGISDDEARALLGYKFRDDNYQDTDLKRSELPKTPVEKRLYIMKNKLRQISPDELKINKLQSSKLSKSFQNTSEFLKSLEMEEIELWESMDDEFDSNLVQMQREYREGLEQSRQLVDEDTLKSVSNIMRRNKQLNKRTTALENSVSVLLRKRVKDLLQDDSQFILNTEV